MKAIVFKSIGTALLALALVFALTLTHPLACTGAQDLRPLESAGGTGQKPSADRHPGD
ncbi:hypothetical protein [Comamonas badia]|jgi:hypothetical protein|uniref:hypothetical protein n=1 Tax=Comamonas badia TaxID=265291 RepID=UPI001B7FCBBD|nr:hypothetical protein [Comamonas badia]